jgi:intein-encoded DNA endonuclease-like protein
MTKGLHTKQSKVEKHRLGHIILDLLSRGWSYNQIIRDIKVRYDVDISKSAISRFLDKSKDIKKQKLYSFEQAFKDHSADTIERIKNTLHNIRTSFNDINRLLDSSSLKPIERSRLKADIKVVRDDMLEEYALIESTTLGLMKMMEDNYKAVEGFIIAFSNELPPDYSKRIADLVDSYKQSNSETK